MSGRFTRKMYDGCAIQQDYKQSTDQLDLIMDPTKYVHCHNICRPVGQVVPNQAQLVDVESSLMGLDKLSSKCDASKHPFCGPNGCLLTNDKNVPPHITPYACDRGHAGDNAVVTTNMQMPKHPGFSNPPPLNCNNANGYYQSNQYLAPLRSQGTTPNVNSPAQTSNANPSLWQSVVNKVHNLF